MKKYIVLSMLGLAVTLIALLGVLEPEQQASGADRKTIENENEMQSYKESLHDELISKDFSIIEDEDTHQNVREMVKNEELHPSQVGVNKTNVAPVEELTKAGFADLSYYTSNYNLYMAYSHVEALAVGKKRDKIDTELLFEYVNEKLNGVYYEGDEKAEEINVVKKLVKEANSKAEKIGKDDEIVMDIYHLLADLESHFNISYY